MNLLAKSFNLPVLIAFSNNLPRNVRTARNCIKNTRDNFTKYVCCPSCHNVYRQEECTIRNSGRIEESKKCTYVRFPSHSQPQHRAPCGATLMKTVKSSTGKTFLYPNLVYCYRSIITSLQELILQPHFLPMCESWRKNYNKEKDVFRDVYDGKIWKDFMIFDNKPFLELPFNLALILNVDWFQPFDHTQH